MYMVCGFSFNDDFSIALNGYMTDDADLERILKEAVVP
jgi:hypothetical protein